jgi:hypothetical protein
MASCHGGGAFRVRRGGGGTFTSAFGLCPVLENAQEA